MSGQIHCVKKGFHEIAIPFDLTELFPSPVGLNKNSDGCNPSLRGEIPCVKKGFHEIAILFDLTELFPSPVGLNEEISCVVEGFTKSG